MVSDENLFLLVFAVIVIVFTWWKFWLGCLVVISLTYFIGWKGMFLLTILLLIQGGIDLAVKRRA